MEGVKEAIMLLKQYGTPVFASAVAGAKFMAISWILGSIVAIVLCLICWKYVPNVLKDVEEDLEKDIKAENNEGMRFGAQVCLILTIILALVFLFNGIYELVSIDYQAYKMMLFK